MPEIISHKKYKCIRTKSYSVPCKLCSFGSVCLNILLNDAKNKVLNGKQKVAKDQILIEQNAPFQKFYIIHSGAVKTYTVENGIEQINGFYLPGDILGLECLLTNNHNSSAKALTESAVCEINYSELSILISNNTEVRDLVFKLMSKEILYYQKLILSFSQKKAEERLAYFVTALYSRYANVGHISLNIKLAMCRSDIANYLGLTVETVSRIFTKMQEIGILTARGKYIYIKDISALSLLAKE